MSTTHVKGSQTDKLACLSKKYNKLRTVFTYWYRSDARELGGI